MILTKQRVLQIQKNAIEYAEAAERILAGGDNYDGADGARIVLQLCDQIEELARYILERKSEQ